MSILLSIAMGLVVLVLFTGVLAFAKGGPWYERHANHLMNLRVAAQALAVVILAALVYVSS